MEDIENQEVREFNDPGIDTGWENPPSLADLKQDYLAAQNHHDAHVTKVNKHLDNLYVKGSAAPKKKIGRSSVVPKLIRKQAEWRYAALSESFLSHEDLFTAEPVTAEDGPSAFQNGLVLNNQFNTKIDKVKFIDEYVRAAVNEGSIVVKVGWDYEDEIIEVPNMVPKPAEPFLAQQIEQAAAMMMQNPEAIQALPAPLQEAIQLSLQVGYPAQLVQEGTKEETKVLVNQPYAEVCDYAAVMIDPSCRGDIKKAQFVIYEFETSLSELKKDGRYENLDEINIEGAAITSRSTEEHSEDIGAFNFKDEPRKKFIAYEYWGFWDFEGDGIARPFLATWVGDTIIRLEESPIPGGELPFILVPYLPVRESVYGDPDGALLEDNQAIAGAVTRGMIDILGRSAAGQTGIRKDALDLTNQRRFDKGEDYYFNPNADPRSAFHTHIYPDIPSSAPFMLQLQNNEAEALTGVKAFHGGISGEGLGRSATAARSAIDAAGKRELGILRRLAKGIVEVGRKIIAMNAEFLSEEEVVRITNEEFVTIKRDDLAGKIDLKLKISTAEADDAKAQELAFMLQTVGNSLPMEFSLMIMRDIARLRKMPELAKSIEGFQPEPDPLAEEERLIEMELKRSQIALNYSAAKENEAEANLDMAKAREASSNADLKDLDYVEQEAGVKQERELEKQGEQARSNERLELTKAALNQNGANIAP